MVYFSIVLRSTGTRGTRNGWSAFEQKAKPDDPTIHGQKVPIALQVKKIFALLRR